MGQFHTDRVSRRSLLVLGASTAALAAPAGWNDADVIEPKVLADRLRKGGTKPLVLHVGFNVLYRSRHIPDSIYAGPGNKPEGLQRLKQTVAALPKNREIVLYCGCCPWIHCPNMKPAFALLRQLGFHNVKAVMMETNFSKDWIQQGYPVTPGPSAGD